MLGLGCVLGGEGAVLGPRIDERVDDRRVPFGMACFVSTVSSMRAPCDVRILTLENGKVSAGVSSCTDLVRAMRTSVCERRRCALVAHREGLVMASIGRREQLEAVRCRCDHVSVTALISATEDETFVRLLNHDSLAIRPVDRVEQLLAGVREVQGGRSDLPSSRIRRDVGSEGSRDDLMAPANASDQQSASD